jgi:hypothetical protein
LAAPRCYRGAQITTAFSSAANFAILAVKIMRILTGEEQEDFGADDGKDKAAQSLGKRGGEARAKRLSSRRKAKIAKKAATARWSKKATRGRSK